MIRNTSSSRDGKGCLLFIIGSVVLAAVIYVGWFAFANRTSNPEDLLDSSKHQTAIDAAKPYVDKVGQTLSVVAAEAWGPGGLVDQATDYFSSRGEDSAPADPSTTPASDDPETDPAPVVEAPKREPSTKTIVLEDKLSQADSAFQEGYAFYRDADPAQGWTEARKQNILKAKAKFQEASKLLRENLGDYEAQPDASAATARTYRELQMLNNRFLANANKMSPGL